MTKKQKIIFLTVFSLIILTISLFFVFKKEEVPVHLFAESIAFDKVKLSWEGSKKSTQYTIYRSEKNSSGYEKAGFSTKEEFLDENLKPSTTYYYKITQTIDLKESEYSAITSVKTKPGVVLGGEATTIDFQKYLRLQIDIIWDYVIGAKEYVVYRSEEKKGIYKEVGRAKNELYQDKNLKPNTTYYYKITQITEMEDKREEESTYSEDVFATTGSLWSCGEKIKYGETEYQTVQIGEQCWFQENLNIKKREEGEDILRKCYQGRESMCEKYGSLYDYNSISLNQKDEKIQGICPLGWRVPTDDDWKKLESEMGMREEQVALYGARGIDEASKLAGNYNFWKNGTLKNSNVFGISGFNALPAGYQRLFKADIFLGESETAVFWSSTQANKGPYKATECPSWEDAYFVRALSYDNTTINRYCLTGKASASLRCMRDY